MARYIIDPEGQETAFVAEFPSTSGEVMGFVYGLELARGRDGQRITPQFLYSFDELGKLAVEGRPAAVAKLFVVTINSDGVVTEFTCERVARVIARETEVALDELAALTGEQRKHLARCFGASSANEISSMRAALVERLTARHAAVASEMIAALDAAY